MNGPFSMAAPIDAMRGIDARCRFYRHAAPRTLADDGGHDTRPSTASNLRDWQSILEGPGLECTLEDRDALRVPLVTAAILR